MRPTKRKNFSPRPHTHPNKITKVSRRQCHYPWYNDDIWTAIARFLDARSLVNFAVTCRGFKTIVMDDMTIWKRLCLRDLEIPAPRDSVISSWKDIYVSAFDGSHSYLFRQEDKHIDWMRIGAFNFETSEALISENLLESKTRCPRDPCILSNVKKGIWIADLQLVRCPVCNLKTCEGTMQVMDLRYCELFLCEEYLNGDWDYEEMFSRTFHGNCFAAAAAVFDRGHIRSKSTTEVLNTKTWTGKPGDWEPKVKTTPHAVAVSTNLQDNEGLLLKCHVLKAGTDGPILAIRLSQQLV